MFLITDLNITSVHAIADEDNKQRMLVTGFFDPSFQPSDVNIPNKMAARLSNNTSTLPQEAVTRNIDAMQMRSFVYTMRES